ncbi:hypothetical protein AXX17_AT2G11360 [Arabidopsis thaliana]|uniref:Uncharacterized protein n=1 Tax=Arabidopsis thaliana TaxID=3702 RepID=A0A178VSK9_ARATH|nr:hypothetical protein AXX17_AT2G11360 [Arabidopsis thaliana]
MEGVGGDAASMASSPVQQRANEAWRLYQYYLDKTKPHAVKRWIGTLLTGFLSPLVDPELDTSDGPMLPTKGSDEFKPFIRWLPEFKFW